MGDAVERTPEAIRADLRPKIRTRAAAGEKQAVGRGAGRGVASFAQHPRRKRDAFEHAEREFRRLGAPVEAEEGALELRVPQRRPLAFELRQEQDRPPVAIGLFGQHERAGDIGSDEIGEPLQGIAAGLVGPAFTVNPSALGKVTIPGAPMRLALTLAMISLVPLIYTPCPACRTPAPTGRSRRPWSRRRRGFGDRRALSRRSLP